MQLGIIPTGDGVIILKKKFNKSQKIICPFALETVFMEVVSLCWIQFEQRHPQQILGTAGPFLGLPLLHFLSFFLFP